MKKKVRRIIHFFISIIWTNQSLNILIYSQELFWKIKCIDLYTEANIEQILNKSWTKESSGKVGEDLLKSGNTWR